MTMVNSTTVSTPPTNRGGGGGGVSLRKTNKPLMEKRRRARINDSLSQLKSLVIHSSKKDSSQFSKLEKADILELTVKHLRGLQAQQRHHQQHPLAVQSTAPTGPTDGLVNGKYTAGFVECANEVMRYLDQSQGFNMETKNKVVSHLASCLQLVNTSSAQSKVTTHPQPISQQPQAPPNTASAILAAAAAAASNGTTTTTQLPNGQIVQIVSNPLQNVPSANGVPTIVGLNPTPLQCHGATTTTIQGINLSTQSDQQPTSSQPTHLPAGRPNPIQAAYHINYAQPLHIQIPPIVSPVLIQKRIATNQIKHKESAIPNKQFLSFSVDHSHQSMPHDESRDTHSSSSSVSSSSTCLVSSSSSLPKNTVISPPPALYPGLPKVRAQKQLNFNMQEVLKFDNYSTPGKQPSSVTTPPSSSSSSPSSTSSSSEENTSPLNLSQSPSFLQMETDHHHHSNLSLKSRRDSHSKQQRQSVCPYQVRASLENIDCNNGTSRFNNNTYLPKSSRSVIVNSQKCVDFTEGKYWSMMEEERHCLRQRNTPSPASSVGEERLWRPW